MLLKDAEIYLICNPVCNQIWNCADMFKLECKHDFEYPVEEVL